MIRVGIIGCGFMGRHHFAQYEQLAPHAAVVALCDPIAQRRTGDWSQVGGNLGEKQGARHELQSVKPYADYRELLADANIDMVDICVPTYLHHEIAIAALAAGKHVLCEKPMALTPAHCETMLAAAAEAKGKFMIAQVIRFWPEYVFLKQVIDERRYGTLKALHLRRQASTPDYSVNDWLLDASLSGGAILDLHVHDVDYALQILGRPNAVTASGYQRDGGAVDRVHAVWHYDRDTSVQVEGSWDMPVGFPFNMGFTAVFERAALVWDMSRGKEIHIYRPGAEPETNEAGGPDGYLREITYFLECIEKGARPTISTPQESRDAVAVALAERESALDHRTVTLHWKK